MQLPLPVEFVLVASLGLIFGSYASLLAYRIPRNLPTAAARSRCTACGAKLRARDLVPLFSWLARRGRSGCCGKRIGFRYPLIELAAAGTAIAAWAAAGTTTAGLLAGLLGITLLVAILVDFEAMIIPDETMIAAALLGIAWRVLVWAAWPDALAGAALAGGLGLLLRVVFRKLKGRDALGLGDVKLMAVAGFWLGPQVLPWLLVGAGILGIATAMVWRWRGLGDRFPFGPALAAAFYALLLASLCEFTL
jgi:leader peptidase (prepilin peptidase)/N-methyltransferase